MFKKLIIISAFFTLSASLMPVVVLADAYGIEATKNAVNANGVLLPESIAGADTIPGIIGNIVAVGLGLVGIAFFLLALYAGVTWMKAMGNTEEVTKAKDILEAAVIGLVLVLAAYAISSFVFKNLAGAGAGGQIVKTAEINSGGSIAHGSNTDPIVTCNGSADTEGKHCGDNSYCKGTVCMAQCYYENIGACVAESQPVLVLHAVSISRAKNAPVRWFAVRFNHVRLY